MLLKRVFLTFSLAIVAIAANAQWSVGVLAGYDYNLYDYAKGYAYDLRYDGRAGLDFTVPVQYNFNQWFGLRADIDYVQKGHKMHRSGIHQGSYTNTRDHYLHLPIVASFSFGGEKIRGYLNLGGYMGFWAVSSIEGQARLAMAPDIDDTQYYYFNEKLDFDSKRDNRFDAGRLAWDTISSTMWNSVPKDFATTASSTPAPAAKTTLRRDITQHSLSE